MRKSEAVNTFNNGLIMDINPLVTPNDVLVNALNATVITFNGNENVLQNDMGNGRVETAYLPEGYVPVGTAELGGIIYIVSYNPLIDKCLIGSFPSPERNITSDEIQTPSVIVSNNNFLADDSITRGKLVKNVLLKIKLLSDPSSEDGLFKLNPGDKYTIYATNVTNNSKCLSDCLNNDPNKVDYTPRNITIHVVSLGEDGKITYLDDSLKWTVYEANNNYIEYYIKEVDAIELEKILKDIDSYRSLVSSAYNIFNSKISGELALLFEVKVIESLLLTWDATVSDTEGIDDVTKRANIVFYANWTSSHKDINPKYLILSNSELVNVTSSDVGIGYWAGISGYSDRINDGTDSSVSVEVGNFTYDPDSTLEDCLWNYTVIPAMKFGELLYLAVSGTINFSEIGSGKMNIDEWRYYIQENNFYIDLGLDAYPEINKSINKLILTFIPFEEILIDNTILTSSSSETKFAQYDKYPQYTISGKSSYSGYFQEIINFGLNVRVTNLGILKNYLYLVDIGIMYGSENNWEIRHNYKWLYTTGQWNLVYLDGEITDFTTLTLDDYIGFETITSIEDTISKTETYTNTSLSIPEDLPSNSYDMNYATLGARIATVNYSLTKYTFDKDTTSILVDLQVVPSKYTELFKFNLQSADLFKDTITGKTITHDEFSVESDTISAISDYVISKVMEEDMNQEEVEKALKNILSKGSITTGDIDELAIDSFNATIIDDDMQGLVKINVIGAIFSRINADLKEALVTASQLIRPILLYEDEYNDLGIESLDKMELSFGIDRFSKSRKMGFSASMYDSNGNSLKHEDSSYRGKNGTWNNYWDCDSNFYWNILMSYINCLNGPFVVMKYSDTHPNNEVYQISRYIDSYIIYQTAVGTNIASKYGIWVKTNGGHYLPIDTVYDSLSNATNAIILCLLLLYYVDNNPYTIMECIVSNINKLKTYKETWNIELSSTLNVNSMANSLYLLDLKGNEISLKNLQDKCSPLSISTENITYSNTVLDLGSTSIAHTFKMGTTELYLEYEEYKSTSIASLWETTRLSRAIKGTSKNSNYLYAFDYNNNDMVSLQISSNCKYILKSVKSKSIQTDGKILITDYNFATNGISTSLFKYFHINSNNELVADESTILSKVRDYRYYCYSTKDDHYYFCIHNNIKLDFPI